MLGVEETHGHVLKFAVESTSVATPNELLTYTWMKAFLPRIGKHGGKSVTEALISESLLEA